MDFNEIFNVVTGNPIYLAVATLLIILLVYSLIKKFVKILIIVLICIAGYIGVLYFQGDLQTVKDVDQILEEVDKAMKPIFEEGKEVYENATDNFKGIEGE
mgnify:CR=1 FL=1